MIAFVPLSGKKYPILGALAHGLIEEVLRNPDVVKYRMKNEHYYRKVLLGSFYLNDHT